MGHEYLTGAASMAACMRLPVLMMCDEIEQGLMPRTACCSCKAVVMFAILQVQFVYEVFGIYGFFTVVACDGLLLTY